MNTVGFFDEVRHLGALETFDPAAFEPDMKWPAEICDFILALAVASNDLHDSFLAVFLLMEERGAHEKRSKIEYQALSAGVTITLRRLQIGVVHELLRLVSRNRTVIESGSFQDIYGRLDRSSKASWRRIYNAARSKPASGTLGRALLMCRNKVGFHYDPEQISKGYRHRFLRDQKNGPPVLSRGSSMRARRFYFSDAAIDQYMFDLINDPEIEETFLGKSQLIQDINRALFDIVTRFINARGFGYREYRHK